MRLTLTFIIVVLFSSISIYGQSRTITGRVINEDLLALPQASIQSSDSLILGTTDMDGRFKIEVSNQTKTLLIGAVGMEWQSIQLPASCDRLEVVLMNHGSYDFMSARKVDKLREQQFERLPELHQAAYSKGLFSTEKPCYKREFIPIKRESKDVRSKRTGKPSA